MRKSYELFIAAVERKGHTVVAFDVPAGGHDAMTWMGDIPTGAIAMHAVHHMPQASQHASAAQLLSSNLGLFRRCDERQHVADQSHKEPHLQHAGDRRPAQQR